MNKGPRYERGPFSFLRMLWFGIPLPRTRATAHAALQPLQPGRTRAAARIARASRQTLERQVGFEQFGNRVVGWVVHGFGATVLVAATLDEPSQ